MKLKTRLILYYLAATVLSLVFVGIAVFRGVDKLRIATMERQMIEQSSLAEIYISQIHTLESLQGDELTVDTSEKVINKLRLVIGNVNIYDNSLKLLSSSKGNEKTTIDEGINKKVLTSASEGNYAYIIKDNTVYFASPIYIEDKTIGILEIISPMTFLDSVIKGVINIILVGALFFTILMIILISYIAGKITKPINKLAVAASNYANRNFTAVEIKGADEISQLSKSFNAMGIQLQDYIQRQKQFVANVSHELKTPLTAIKGYSEYLKEELVGSPDIDKALYHLTNEANRLTKLVEEVLTLSRIDSNAENFKFESFNFSKLINETIEKLQQRAEKYKIKLILDVEDNIHISGDREKIMQVIINLMDNAFKFSSAQSSVKVQLCKEGKEAVLTVMDQGIGIPAGLEEKIFERFYRAENAQGVTGTGLGLSIVKNIIDAHGGIIELIGVPTGGTLVKARLPRNL